MIFQKQVKLKPNYKKIQQTISYRKLLKKKMLEKMLYLSKAKKLNEMTQFIIIIELGNFNYQIKFDPKSQPWLKPN